jgi:hypothetical protein
MTKKYFIFFCCFFLSIAVFSQRTIKGKVVTADNVPVPGSSVFISNTSTGTTSDKNGSFELDNVPVGKHDLIISSIGYETNVYSFSAEQLPLQLKVVMQLKVKELQNVLVEPSVEEGWNTWGKLFTENFIGSTPNALNCKIKNEKAIKFRHFKKSGRLIAYCDEPIILENKALGYIIHYQMEDFEVNFKQRSSAFAGYPFFEEIDKKRKGLQNKWQQRRDKAYYGSMMHFMRSLYTDSLSQQGFEVRRMVKVPNTEKERVKQIYKASGGTLFRGKTGTVTMSSNLGKPGIVSPRNLLNQSNVTDSVSYDSIAYYRKIMDQEDFKEIYGRELLTPDSIIVKTEGKYKIIFFPDYLYITYKKEFEDIEYITFSGENRGPTFQRSYIWLTNTGGVLVDENGSYFPPQSVFSMAYWGWNEKMSDLLPIDYSPGGK